MILTWLASCALSRGTWPCRTKVRKSFVHDHVQAMKDFISLNVRSPTSAYKQVSVDVFWSFAKLKVLSPVGLRLRRQPPNAFMFSGLRFEGHVFR
jgi:hypothetical protein